MQRVEQLQQQFAHLGETVQFREGAPGLPLIEVRNAACEATLTLQGAYVIHHQPRGAEPLIWLSDTARFVAGKSLRGGVPICWPWFGAHESDPTLPPHGYARTQPWRLLHVQAVDAEHTRLEFALEEDERSRAMWPHRVLLRYRVTLGRQLQLELVSHNLDDHPVTLGAALHSYFRVGEVGQVAVDGLDGCDYLDKVDNFARKRQQGLVTFAGETDRIYLDTPRRLEIRDPLLKRRIVIESGGSCSTVVWNPGREQAAKMGDLGSEGHRRMVCVETANAAEDVVQLAPGAVHRLCARYTLTPL